MEDTKLPPYQRLKSILTDGDPLSERGLNNLDDILDIKRENKVRLIDKIIAFFKKIDSYIFKKNNNMWNTTPHKRK
jgi:hypothetical protein